MSKGNVLVISRTPWSEVPRIRHQLSRLLRDMGYEVYYLSVLFKGKDIASSGEKGIHLYSVREIIHHQLKPFQFIQAASTVSLKKKIRKTLPVKDFKAVFNFNYDNHSIRDVIPGTPVVTVMNDDFIAMAKLWMKRAAKRSLARTCRESDKVLSVSYSIDAQLKKMALGKAELLLPWSDTPYQIPQKGLTRNVVLYYGFISRLDENLIDGLCANGIRMRFIGPVEGNGNKLKQKYAGNPNITFEESQPIEKVFLADVCCSIALYDTNSGANKAITASNRMFRLLSLGIPLVYPDMANLIHAPETVIRKCKTVNAFIASIDFFRKNFDGVQPDIEHFMQEHTIEKRAVFLEELIAGLGEKNNKHVFKTH